MALPHDVTLPRGTAPLFPDRCVVCLRARPRSTVEVSGRHFSLWGSVPVVGWLIPWKEKDRATAPACGPCARSLRRAQLGWALFQGVVIAAAIVVAILFEPFGEGKWPGFLFVFCGIVIAVLPKLLFPPALDLEPGARTITYEFKSRDYAAVFADLNGAEAE